MTAARHGKEMNTPPNWWANMSVAVLKTFSSINEKCAEIRLLLCVYQRIYGITPRF